LIFVVASPFSNRKGGQGRTRELKGREYKKKERHPFAPRDTFAYW